MCGGGVYVWGVGGWTLNKQCSGNVEEPKKKAGGGNGGGV